MSESFPEVVWKNLTSLITLEEREERRVLRFEWKVVFGENVLVFVQVTLLKTDAEVFVVVKIRVVRRSCSVSLVTMIMLCCKNIFIWFLEQSMYVVAFALRRI